MCGEPSDNEHFKDQTKWVTVDLILVQDKTNRVTVKRDLVSHLVDEGALLSDVEPGIVLGIAALDGEERCVFVLVA